MLVRYKVRLCLLASLFTFQAGAQTIGGCPVFPANNIWNTRIDTLAVHARSAAWVTSIGPSATLHQDFNSVFVNGALPGMPITLVTGAQPKVPIILGPGAAESDPGPYPFPPDAGVEAGSDAHVLVVDTTNCLLYETYASVKNADNSWTADSGAVFDLRKNLLRPQTWTSADAAGLPIMPGLVRYEEILAGEIKHALRFTAPHTTREFLWPARHFASLVNDPTLPSMGARFRLKASFDISSFTPTTQIILTALKRYGMMLADNGSSWFIQGANDLRWPDLADEWRRIPGSAFEAVDVTSLIDSIDSAAVAGSTVTAPTLVSASLTPASVPGGAGSTLRVTLSASAPAGGVQVTLASSNGAVAPVVPAVTIPEGSVSADVALTTNPVSTNTVVTFTATLAGISRQASLTVAPPAATLQSAAFLAASVTGGQAATLRLTLSGAAPAAGATVALLSANPSVASVPGSVIIPSGSSTVDVSVSTSVVQTSTPVVFTATLAGISRQATLTVNPPASTATLVSAVVAAPALLGGAGTTLTITLSQAAPASGFAVALASNSPAAGVQASVTVPSGSLSVQVPVTTAPVGTQTQVTLTASAAGVSRQATLTVNPPAVASVTLSPASVPGGTGSVGKVMLSGNAPAAGFTVTLGSGNTAAATVPPSILVPGGQSTATFAIATKAVTATTNVQITASAPGSSAAASLTVGAAPIATLSGLSAVVVQGGTMLQVNVSLSGPAGASGAVVTLAGSNDGLVALTGRQMVVGPGATGSAALFTVNPAPAGTTLKITASLAGVSKSTSVYVPRLVTVTIKSLDAPRKAAVNSLSLATVTLTGPAPSNAAAPVVSTTGVIAFVQWVTPIQPGGTVGSFYFKAGTAGNGSLSVRFGPDTKSVQISAR